VGAAPEQGVVFASGPGGVFAFSQVTGDALAGGAAVAVPDAATRFFGVAGALVPAPAAGVGPIGCRRLSSELIGADAAAARAAVRAAFSAGVAALPACGTAGEPAGTFLVRLPADQPAADWEAIDGLAFRLVPGVLGQGLRDAAFTASGHAVWLLGSSHGSVALVAAASGQLLRAVMPPAGVASEQMRALVVLSEPANEKGAVHRLAVLTSAALYELTVPLDDGGAATWKVMTLAPSGERFVSIAVAPARLGPGGAFVGPTTTASLSPTPPARVGGTAGLAIASGAAAAGCGATCWIPFIASACIAALAVFSFVILGRARLAAWIASAAAKHTLPVVRAKRTGAARRVGGADTMTANPLRSGQGKKERKAGRI
jgi:hypothetical protein